MVSKNRTDVRPHNMKRVLMCSLIVAALTGCSNRPPTVVLDDWWNIDFARSTCESATAWHKQNSALISQTGCDAVTSCKDMMPRVDACRFDDTGGVNSFQDDLATEFASNPRCATVTFVKFSGPEHVSKASSSAMARDHWHLQFDFIPGAKTQSWSLSHLGKSDTFAQGTGDARQIANKVCAVTRGIGARVSN